MHVLRSSREDWVESNDRSVGRVDATQGEETCTVKVKAFVKAINTHSATFSA